MGRLNKRDRRLKKEMNKDRGSKIFRFESPFCNMPIIQYRYSVSIESYVVYPDYYDKNGEEFLELRYRAYTNYVVMYCGDSKCGNKRFRQRAKQKLKRVYNI